MSTTDGIKQRVISELVAATDRNLRAEEITLESSLRNDLGIDSLQAVTLVLSLEDSFDIEVEDEELEALETVGDIIGLIESKQRRTAP